MEITGTILKVKVTSNQCSIETTESPSAKGTEEGRPGGYEAQGQSEAAERNRDEYQAVTTNGR